MRSGSGSVRGTGIQSHGLSTLYLGSATALRLADDWLAEPGVGDLNHRPSFESQKTSDLGLSRRGLFKDVLIWS